MKIQLASDLHLELLQRDFPGERLIAPASGADVLVLAGDIANGTHAIDLFGDWPVPVLYLAGNHEFYGRSLEQTRRDLRNAAEGTHVHFLDNNVVDFGGVRFLGATLWTDYRLSHDKTQRHLMEIAERRLNDHRRIGTQQGPFSATRALAEHEQSRRWLACELDRPYDGKTVVITHHGPNPRSIHPRYAGDPLNAAFVSSHVDALLDKADLWLHGHVHDSFDYRVGKCRVVVNPLGYARNRTQVTQTRELQFENPAFEWACVLDTNSLGTPKAKDGGYNVSPTPLSGWVCALCAECYLGPAQSLTHTYHAGRCGFCHRERAVTAIDDFHPRPTS